MGREHWWTPQHDGLDAYRGSLLGMMLGAAGWVVIGGLAAFLLLAG
jgi:hypothetical protein